ncbi:TetR/AcrR family transcriptional regulator [Acinetobacter sp. WU_MDCI_Abxe161]|uniref:TetR/AcrR family transcriptional regulator n=1 Tax=Acinetobacter sp. WU_MDCI_Abxe161 TaxID=2850074 RepID=UPI0021CD440B|nr:TetR/AcrR family transcriptional regulator [Acinetobacter sp. WU_MDCI_Abxe161]MCU4503492.1 TetR/AcrR family transcriptional regulator [Acinetobacter sp. WU_MDCI_Abxe161]
MQEKGGKKALIIDVATELFGKYGYHAVGVDWIIREAGISKKTLYNHFNSKENLIIEVLINRDKECFTSLNQLLMDVSDPLMKLELIFNWHDEWFNQQTFTGCIFAKAASEFPNKGEEINKIATQQKTGLMNRIEKILEEIVLSEKAKSIAPIVIMLLDGATLSAQVIGNKNSANDAWEVVKQLLK